MGVSRMAESRRNKMVPQAIDGQLQKEGT